MEWALGRGAGAWAQTARSAILPTGTMADSEAQIIEAVLHGDVDRFAELVDAHQAQAIRVAFSFLGDYEEARDVAQDAFVDAYRSLGRFRGRAKFSTWLYRIVINGCKDARRRQARQPAVVAAVGDPEAAADDGLFVVDVHDPSAGPSDQLAHQELSRRISQAIEQLPDKQREAFVLHHLHGLALADVADVMGCRVGTVKSHVFRATEQLKQRLESLVGHEGS